MDATARHSPLADQAQVDAGNHLQAMIGTALVASALAATPGRAAPTPDWSLGATESSPAAAYSIAVTQICAGSLLFDNAHKMGTRSDALSIADDIRASTARRLDRVTALSVLEKLVHAPDALKLAARRLELGLHVPDCTGGG